jgi:hypothetical protein
MYLSGRNIRLVMMAKGNHAYPSRTRPLSLSAPMVLGPQGPGRVGRRQAGAHAPMHDLHLENWIAKKQAKNIL